MLKQFAARVPEVEARGEAVVDLAGRPFAIRRAFVEEARAQEQAPRIAALGRALLVMHAPTDGVVGVENAAGDLRGGAAPEELRRARRRGPPAFAPGGRLLRRAGAGRLGLALPAGAPRPPRPRPPSPRWSQRKGGGGGGNGRGALPAGGDGRAPPAAGRRAGLGRRPRQRPFALRPAARLARRLHRDDDPALRGAQGSRAARGSASRCATEKIHAADCAECETREGKLDEIGGRSRWRATSAPRQRARLLEIADRCPVHRTLHSEVRVLTAATPVPGTPNASQPT